MDTFILWTVTMAILRKLKMKRSPKKVKKNICPQQGSNLWQPDKTVNWYDALTNYATRAQSGKNAKKIKYEHKKHQSLNFRNMILTLDAWACPSRFQGVLESWICGKHLPMFRFRAFAGQLMIFAKMFSNMMLLCSAGFWQR